MTNGHVWRVLEKGSVLQGGMSVLERRGILHSNSSMEVAGGGRIVNQRNEDTITRWRDVASEAGQDVYDRVLSSYALNERELALLASAQESISFQTYVRLYLPDRCADSLADELPEGISTDHASFAIVCEPLIAPFVHNALMFVGRLQKQNPKILEIGAVRIVSGMMQALWRALGHLVRKSCVLEMHVAELRGQLAGDDPSARYASFLELLGTPAYRERFLSEYTVISHQAVVYAGFWLGNIKELCARLCRDYEDIKCVLFEDREIGAVVGMEAAADGRCGHRSVVRLKFESGNAVIYKPRNIMLQEAFNGISSRIGVALGDSEFFRPVKCLERADYGWVECVNHEPCSTEHEVRRFYRRHGVYLALFLMLRSSDMHCDNLIARQGYPQIIDCETLLRPGKEKAGGGIGISELSVPMLVTNLDLLPHNSVFGHNNDGVDTSGIFSRPGQSIKTLGVDAESSSDMRITWRDSQLTSSKHLPAIGGALVVPENYTLEICNGFRSGYFALCNGSLTGDIKSILYGSTIRVVLRGTMTYRMIEDISLHPDYMRDPLSRELMVATTLARDPSCGSRQIREELVSILRGDTPNFDSSFSSHKIFAGQGHVISDLCESCEDMFDRSVRQISSRNFATHWQTLTAKLGCRASNGLMAEMPAPASGYRVLRTGSEMPCTRISEDDRWVHRKIARQILSVATHSDGHRLWAFPYKTGMEAKDLEFAYGFGGIGNGALGVSLYFMMLSRIMQRRTYESVFANSHDVVMRWLSSADLSSGIGLFDGASGLAFYLASAGRFLGKNGLILKAASILMGARERCDECNSLGVTDGVGGYMLALAAVSREAGEEVVRSAMDCAFDTANRRLTVASPEFGYEYGLSGLVAGCVACYRSSGLEKFLDMAWRAVSIESHLFEANPSQGREEGLGGWRGERVGAMGGVAAARGALVGLNRNRDEANLLQWDLERLKAVSLPDDPAAYPEYDGVADLACYKHAARALGDSGWLQEIDKRAQRYLGKIHRDGVGSVMADSLINRNYPNNPSFIRGLSGLGLGLLYLCHSQEAGLVFLGEV